MSRLPSSHCAASTRRSTTSGSWPAVTAAASSSGARRTASRTAVHDDLPGDRADDLGGDITARLQAAQVVAVQRVLARTTWQKLVAGQSADDVYPEAVADADRAFALLRTGTSDATDAGS
jgi:hypothetical protein